MYFHSGMITLLSADTIRTGTATMHVYPHLFLLWFLVSFRPSLLALGLLLLLGLLAALLASLPALGTPLLSRALPLVRPRLGTRLLLLFAFLALLAPLLLVLGSVVVDVALIDVVRK